LEAKISEMVESTTFDVLSAALLEVAGTSLPIGGAVSQQMVGDVQDMPAFHHPCPAISLNVFTS
jgi:hypothetical protein